MEKDTAVDQQKDDQDLSKLDDAKDPAELESSTGEAGEGAESDDEVQENQIVYSDEDGSQPKKKRAPNKRLRNRIKKLNVQKKGFEVQASQATEDLKIANETIAVQQAQIRQFNESEVPKEPNADDYEDGVHDPKYMKAREDALVKRVEAVAEKKTPAQAVPDTSSELLNSQELHYDRAEKLGVKGYEEAEDAAIEILGQDAVNLIIQTMDNSEMVLCHLGKNKDKAENIAHLIGSKSQKDTVKAIFELGVIGRRLKVKPVANVNQAPDPDMELEGAAPANSNYERQLDKLRGEVSAGKRTMKDIIAFKRKHVERLAKV